MRQRSWDAICIYLSSEYLRFAVQMAVGTIPLATLVLARCEPCCDPADKAFKRAPGAIFKHCGRVWQQALVTGR